MASKILLVRRSVERPIHLYHFTLRIMHMASAQHCMTHMANNIIVLLQSDLIAGPYIPMLAYNKNLPSLILQQCYYRYSSIARAEGAAVVWLCT